MNYCILLVLAIICFLQQGFAQQWNALGPGLNSIYCYDVSDILIDSQDIYVAGSFLAVDGNPEINYFARWDGHTWHSVAPTLNAPVRLIAKDSQNIYVHGDFTNAGGDPQADYFARWDGRKWHALPSGLTFPPFGLAMEVHKSVLYFGGAFTDFDGNPEADYLVQWDGKNWQPVGLGVNGEVGAIETYGEDIYIGGSFTKVSGTIDANQLMRWHERAFYFFPPLPNTQFGTPKYVDDILVLDTDEIYLAADGAMLSWNGIIWDVILDTASITFALAADQVHVYMGSIYGVYRYNRITQVVDRLPGTLGHVGALATSRTDLYAGGAFLNAGGNPGCDAIARWGTDHGEFVIAGVPNLVCQFDPPFQLPVIQQGIAGSWSGRGVVQNVFYPEQASKLTILSFTPDVGQSYTAISTIDVYVFDIDSVGIWELFPGSICDLPGWVSLYHYLCPPGITGTWSGVGLDTNGVFDPAGLNGLVTLTFTPHFQPIPSSPTAPINVGQCMVDPVWQVDVVNFNHVQPVVSCENGGTIGQPSDDAITILIPPVGTYKDTVYEVSVSSGTITPATGNYNRASLFTLQPGSAGSGNVELTFRDPEVQECEFHVDIPDPGPCFQSEKIETRQTHRPDLVVYPNPASGKVTYHHGLPEGQLHTVTLFDITGRMLLSKLTTGNELDLTDSPPGMFVLKIEAMGRIDACLVIKQ